MEECCKNKEPEKENDLNSSCVIPGDIITYDVLTRVPTESLVRFRCVCKTWSSLFAHNKLFINLHSQRHDNKSNSSGFIDVEHEVDFIRHKYITWLVFINHRGNKRRIIPFKSSNNTLFNKEVRILHSLNGLLLLRCNLTSWSYKYCVYNPITCCSTIIPSPIDNLTLVESRYFCLCYDPLIEKHKVVFCGSYKSRNPKIKVVTVGDGLGGNGGSWRDIVIPDAFHLSDIEFYVDMFDLLGSNTYFDRNRKPHDYLHMMIKPHGSDEYYILRFDATREVYVKIKLPKEVSTLKLKCVLNETEGLLCLSHYTKETHELKVWTLKDYKCDEWAEIRFSLSMEVSERISYVSSIRPLTILTVHEKKLIFAHYLNSSMCYYSYDIEFKQLELIHGPTSNPVAWHWHVNSFANC